MRRLFFVAFVVIGWLAVGASNGIATVDDATTTEAMVPHFIAWILLMVVASLAAFMPEWRLSGMTWQKVIFWLAPALVVADVFFHWIVFDILKKVYGQLGGGARVFVIFTYFAAGPLVLATLVAVLTQLGKRQNVGRA